MREINTALIGEKLYSLIIKTCTRLTPECLSSLKKAKEKEDSPLCSFALSVMIENAKTAEKNGIAVCQDTGLACVFLEIGQEVTLSGNFLEDEINSAVKKAYFDGFFRKSVVDPLTRKNTKDNTPAFIYTSIVKGDKVKISFLPKGFGSENMSRSYMLTPAEGKEGIINSVLDAVIKAGAKPCPPIIVGVGIGGTFDKCANASKLALTRPVGKHNKRRDVSELESLLLERINGLNIGAQGFKGKTTALAVNIEVLPTHIAGLPVCVNIQCHAERFGSVTI